MSELIVLGFDDNQKAAAILVRLQQLQKEYLVDLEDAVVAVRDSEGKVHLQQSIQPSASELAASSGLSGAIWGSLVGWLFLNPLAGMVLGGAIGATTGAIAGSMSDYGIDDGLIERLAVTIPVDSSALFLLVRKAQPEKLLEEFKGEHARILRSSLSPHQEHKLAEIFAGSAAPSAVAG